MARSTAELSMGGPDAGGGRCRRYRKIARRPDGFRAETCTATNMGQSAPAVPVRERRKATERTAPDPPPRLSPVGAPLPAPLAPLDAERDPMQGPSPKTATTDDETLRPLCPTRMQSDLQGGAAQLPAVHDRFLERTASASGCASAANPPRRGNSPPPADEPAILSRSRLAHRRPIGDPHDPYLELRSP